MTLRAIATCAAAAVSCGCVAPEPATDAKASIPIGVMKPDGAGPFPAVVLLHDCSGLGPRSSHAPERWARELVKQGYVVAIPDSFSTRGHAEGVCVDPSPSRNDVAPSRRVPDAYEALDHLRSLPYVDGARIGVMGASHGGATTVATMALQPSDSPAMLERKRHGFAAAIAFYPGCNIGTPRFTTRYVAAAPMLILIGELDDWTPAAPCLRLVEASHAGGAPVSIKVYPDAHHAFDSASPLRYNANRVNPNAPGGRGATTAGNPAAWQDSIRQVDAYFARYLKGGPGAPASSRIRARRSPRCGTSRRARSARNRGDGRARGRACAGTCGASRPARVAPCASRA